MGDARQVVARPDDVDPAVRRRRTSGQHGVPVALRCRGRRGRGRRRRGRRRGRGRAGRRARGR
ncbi:MAG: hypothetical protein E6I26_07965 [Chloroflexi bacterium]|nr:MAG: hypothetical protein E6I26_07965 [Chloroflexota bacterium]